MRTDARRRQLVACMRPQEIRAVLVPVGMRPRVIEAEPATLWSLLGGIPEHFASFALTNFGRRFAAVWCRHFAADDPNRWVFAPMFRYREVNLPICGPILITGADTKRGEALSLDKVEVGRCIRFASMWPHLHVEPNFASPPKERHDRHSHS